MTLTLQGVRFNPRERRMGFEGSLPVDVLSEITKEAFLHSNLIGWTTPIDIMELDGRTYYMIYWEVDGDVTSSKHGGVEHIPILLDFPE